ncbi:hypothetical protein [Microbacterium album]|nr:hypothetical protein [Microbacterium album]
MRKYLLGTGLLGALAHGYSLLRGSGQQRFTWRTALAWLSWFISVALAIGTVVDVRRASRGQTVSDDSPIRGKEGKYYSERAASRSRSASRR